MSERVSDTIGTVIEAFFGGAFFTLAKGSVRTDGAQGGQIVLVREIDGEVGGFCLTWDRLTKQKAVKP